MDGSIFRFEGQVNGVSVRWRVGLATDASIPRRRRQIWRRRETKPVCWAFCPARLASCRPLKVVKLILGQGDPLIGRLLMYDALQMNFNTFKIRRDPSCPVCGDNPTITELMDYQAFCAMDHSERAD